jgi:hypothetical protein
MTVNLPRSSNDALLVVGEDPTPASFLLAVTWQWVTREGDFGSRYLLVSVKVVLLPSDERCVEA